MLMDMCGLSRGAKRMLKSPLNHAVHRRAAIIPPVCSVAFETEPFDGLGLQVVDHEHHNGKDDGHD
jgi:hypothetical protein